MSGQVVEQWPITTLGEIATIQSGSGFPVKFQGNHGEQYPFYKVGDMNTEGNEVRMENSNHTITEEIRRKLKAKIFPAGSIIFPKVGGAIRTNKKRIIVKECCVDNNVMGLIPNEKKILPAYLFYFMTSVDLFEFSNKAALPSIRQSTVSEWEIPVPSLEEQQRIVSILDEAFQNIASSTDNVQSVSNSVKELIETKLQTVFHEDSFKWKKIPFEKSIVKVKATPKIKKREFKEFGSYPIISQEKEFINGYWNNSEDLLTIQTPVVVFGDHTKHLKYIDFDFVRGADGMKILQPIESILPKFFYHQLRSVKLETLGYARHYRLLKQIEIRVPSMEHQYQIASMFDDLDENISQINGLYETELQSLQQLKESILQEAFSGKLTGGTTA